MNPALKAFLFPKPTPAFFVRAASVALVLVAVFQPEPGLGGPVTGGPMTYSVDGRQFIVATVGGPEGAELVGLAVPQPRPAAAKPKP